MKPTAKMAKVSLFNFSNVIEHDHDTDWDLKDKSYIQQENTLKERHIGSAYAS